MNSMTSQVQGNIIYKGSQWKDHYSSPTLLLTQTVTSQLPFSVVCYNAPIVVRLDRAILDILVDALLIYTHLHVYRECVL